MHKSKLVTWILILGITGFLFLAGLGVAIYLSKLPKGTDMIPPGMETVHVSITSPVGESAWPLDSYIPIKATISSKSPIASVKLYINGELYDAKVLPEGEAQTEYIAEWNWQPGTTGRFYLISYATSREGGAGNSQPLTITAIPSGGTRQLVTAQGGETLAGMAETHNISLSSMQDANPGVDPEQGIEPGADIFIPNPPAEISNDHIIAGIPIDLSMFEPETGPGENGNPPEQGITPETPAGQSDFPDLGLVSANWVQIDGNDPPIVQDSFGLIDKLKLSLKGDEEKKGDNAPDQPTVTIGLAANTNCDVDIKGGGYFGDLSDPGYDYLIPKREDGFYIYRSRDGGAFERIASFPANTGSGYNGTDNWVKLVDKAEYGLVTYTVSAFNGYGETFSEPASLPLGELGCKNQHALTNPFQPMLVGDELVMPYSKSDMAYFYIQVNDSAGIRVPEGDRTFLSGSGGKFNIRNYLETIIDQFPEPDLNLKMQIWVWDNGKLKHLGDFETNFHRAVLQVCSVAGEGGCTGSGGGIWTTDIVVDNSTSLLDRVYEMRWFNSNLSKTKDAELLIASDPYSSMIDPESSSSMISRYAVKGMAADGLSGVFTYDLGSSLYPDAPIHGKEYFGWPHGSEYTSNYFQESYPIGTPFTIYARMFAINQIYGLNRISNTVTLRYNTPPEPAKTPPLSSPYTSLYTVEILRDTYSLPNFPVWNDWGCVVIDADPTNEYPVGSTQCPGKINPAPAEDCGWNPLCYYSAMFTPMASAWDYAIKIFNDAKASIVGAIASVIPGCSGSSACTGALTAALDYGIEALTGIPPLPSSDAIVSGQVNAFIDSELGGLPVGDYLCNDECKKLTSQKITEQLIKARSVASQTACLDVITAYYHGQYNSCLDPSIQVHPAKGALYYPGLVMVKVTRKDTPEANAVPQSESGNYKLFLGATGENFNRKGYWGYNCEYRDNITQAQLPDPTDPTDLANFDYGLFYKDKEEGTLYHPQYLNIPWLQPGQSVEMPVKLDTFTQWMSTDDQPSCVNNVDFRYLFFRGITHMQAAEYCLSPGSTQEWVPCTNGGKDIWDFANPEVP